MPRKAAFRWVGHSFIFIFGQKISWRSFFDLIVVDTRKPLFFAEGTVLRQVDTVRRRRILKGPY